MDLVWFRGVIFVFSIEDIVFRINRIAINLMSYLLYGTESEFCDSG